MLYFILIFGKSKEFQNNHNKHKKPSALIRNKNKLCKLILFQNRIQFKVLLLRSLFNAGIKHTLIPK